MLTSLGVICLRQQDLTAARDAFVTAVAQADAMLANNAESEQALDSKALALCGLALCGEPQHLSAAVAAYRKAREVNKNVGIVRKRLESFDALAVADSAGILAEVRSVAGGD